MSSQIVSPREILRRIEDQYEGQNSRSYIVVCDQYVGAERRPLQPWRYPGRNHLLQRRSIVLQERSTMLSGQRICLLLQQGRFMLQNGSSLLQSRPCCQGRLLQGWRRLL